ncbi:SDR family oxidoreductase, partial [Streptomyces sparsus]
MRIAITGGTGTLGRRVSAQLGARGHEVRVLSRHSPEYRVDLRTGVGLEEALRDVDVVVDASNAASTKGAAATLVEGSRRLLAAGSSAGVRHHVCVSIVGCERVPSGYYRAKVAQERLVEQGPLPWTLVRATQFHELLAAALAAAARSRVLPVPRARLQTVSADEVAVAVADAAERP